jgi:hypothetical protein
MTQTRRKSKSVKKTKVSHTSQEEQGEASQNIGNMFSQLLSGIIKELHILYEFNVITNICLID